MLLSNKADPNICDAHGNPPFFYLYKRNIQESKMIEIMELFIKHKANINYVNQKNGNELFTLSAITKQKKLIKFLLKNGLNINKSSPVFHHLIKKFPPIQNYNFVEEEFFSMSNFFYKKLEMDISAQDNKGNTIVSLAAQVKKKKNKKLFFSFCFFVYFIFLILLFY